MIVLDTNIVSETMRPTPEARVLVWLNAQEASALYITAITVAELQAGVEKLQPGQRREGLQAYVSAVLAEFSGRTLAFDGDAALQYAQIVGPILRTKAEIQTLDFQIAAIARLHGAAVATRNIKHFESCRVDLIDPWAP